MTASFLVVAFSQAAAPRLAGLALASIAQQLGEVTFLALCGRKPVGAVGGWASGSGAAGLLGAGSWIILKGALHLPTETSLLWLSPAPLLLSVIYIALLRDPSPVWVQRQEEADAAGLDVLAVDPVEGPKALQSPEVIRQLLEQQVTESEEGKDGLGTARRWATIRALALPYMLPLVVVYFFEYLMNQAMALPLGFAVTSKAGQAKHAAGACSTYRNLQLMYQTGVFLSRSSVHFLPLPVLWPLPVLQGLNAALALVPMVWYHAGGAGVPPPLQAWLLAFFLWEGLLGGATYVNAFTNISKMFSSHRQREFGLGVTSLADNLGVVLAAGTALLLEPRLISFLGVDGHFKC